MQFCTDSNVMCVMCIAVDGDPVPVPHFGMALEVQQFHDLAARVKEAGINFILDPHVRFEGIPSLPSKGQCLHLERGTIQL